MIRGRFDHYRRPYVLGRLILPRWNIQGEVDFLVDTGADSTIIHPYDGHRLRVPFPELESEIVSVGIGGRHPYCPENAVLLFEDGAGLREYHCEVLIGRPSGNSDRLPSLLGRPLLNRWRMLYDPTDDRLTMTHRE